jgi:hypothetical protein
MHFKKFMIVSPAFAPDFVPPRDDPRVAVATWPSARTISRSLLNLQALSSQKVASDRVRRVVAGRASPLTMPHFGHQHSRNTLRCNKERAPRFSKPLSHSILKAGSRPCGF